MVPDVRRGVLRVRVESNCVLDELAVDHKTVVPGLALPRAVGMLLALAEIIPVYGTGREVVVAFRDIDALALSYDGPVRHRSRHLELLSAFPRV